MLFGERSRRLREAVIKAKPTRFYSIIAGNGVEISFLNRNILARSRTHIIFAIEDVSYSTIAQNHLQAK